MKTIFYLLFFCILVSPLACTKKEPPPKSTLDLIENYKKAQGEMPTFDERLKKAGTNEGEQIKINYEKELAKSRLERMKEQLKTLSPETLEGEAAGGGGGGGHGGGH